MAKGENLELKSLRWATVILVVLSLGVFLMQRFVVTIFTTSFEVFVFYFSTIVSMVMYLWKRRSFQKPRGRR